MKYIQNITCHKIGSQRLSVQCFEKGTGEITGEIDVEAVGPGAQSITNHRRERPHAKHHTCCLHAHIHISNLIVITAVNFTALRLDKRQSK